MPKCVANKGQKEKKFACRECPDNIFCERWGDEPDQRSYPKQSEDTEGQYDWICPDNDHSKK